MNGVRVPGRRSLRVHGGNGVRPPCDDRAGFSLLEMLIVLAVLGIVGAMAVAPIASGLDGAKTRGAAFYLSSRFALARTLAVQRQAKVAFRFEPQDEGIRVRTFLDTNGNGVLSAEIVRGIDVPILPDDRLDQQFGGVSYGFIEGARLIDGRPVSPGDDPVRFGTSDMLVFSPSGTATAGTVYLRGRDRSQYAVVVLGATGRTRIVRFDVQTRAWVER